MYKLFMSVLLFMQWYIGMSWKYLVASIKNLLILLNSETNMKLACNVGREDLLSFGTCFGKFTKTNKFRLHITALDYLAPYAKVSKLQYHCSKMQILNFALDSFYWDILCLQHKIWLKPNAEQQFLYGHNVMKTGLARISENTLKYQGVIIYSMTDVPLVRVFYFYKFMFFLSLVLSICIITITAKSQKYMVTRMYKGELIIIIIIYMRILSLRKDYSCIEVLCFYASFGGNY